MNPQAIWRNFVGRFDMRAGTLKADLVAGITVSLVAIPQSLAYAQLAGVPAYYGLYAALIPTVIGALFGSSNQLSTGPVAMTSLLTAASIAPLAGHGSELFYSYAILLALVSGLFQIAFGLFRVGVLLNFLSNPVLMGFINAAAIIIGLSQLPTLLGIPAAQSEHFLLDISRVLMHIDTAHALSIGFGISAIFMLLGFKRFAPKLPGVLMTVASLTWISYVIDYANLGGRVVGVVPQGLPTLSLPPLDWHATVALLPASFVIALISFMEAMSSCKVIAIKTRQPWDENKELIGQGLAKVAAAFCQSMPVSGSFSRSALNLASDARTPLSSIISAVFVLLTLLFFTSLLFHLPKPVLAAIIMMAVINLINFQSVRNAWRASRDDGIAAIVTFTATLAFAPNIQNGILTGIILSLSLLLYRMMRPRIAVLGLHSDTTLRDAVRHNLPPLHPKLGAIRFDGALRFVNVSYFEDALLKLERENPEMECILVQSSGINEIDASGIEMLRNLLERFQKSGIKLTFSGLKKQVSDVMDRTGLTDKISAENIFATDRMAIDEICLRLDRQTEFH
ncbi:putative sulfate transporterc [mine drainage metagenome]|uniref:Putative sulfate transporterc n=1 Tax=mine drainage metagenome TaxID=410659 RepID=A0A1J5T6B3_9ZZZZ